MDLHVSSGARVQWTISSRLHSAQCTLKPASERTTGSSVSCLSTIIIKLLLANHPDSAFGKHTVSLISHTSQWRIRGSGLRPVLLEEVLRESGVFFFFLTQCCGLGRLKRLPFSSTFGQGEHPSKPPPLPGRGMGTHEWACRGPATQVPRRPRAGTRIIVFLISRPRTISAYAVSIVHFCA